ncbi:hypothetical protein Y695_04173 [Hydrogenophaga sp. T4]|nr:hypothetical protein Y695_04173 [Hydrogenophaga sp. T4]
MVETPGAAMPRPSSSTTNSRPAGVLLMMIAAWRAMECLAMLASASCTMKNTWTSCASDRFRCRTVFRISSAMPLRP